MTRRGVVLTIVLIALGVILLGVISSEEVVAGSRDDFSECSQRGEAWLNAYVTDDYPPAEDVTEITIFVGDTFTVYGDVGRTDTNAGQFYVDVGEDVPGQQFNMHKLVTIDWSTDGHTGTFATDWSTAGWPYDETITMTVKWNYDGTTFEKVCLVHTYPDLTGSGIC